MTSNDIKGQWCGFMALLTPSYLMKKDISFLWGRINYYFPRFFQFWMSIFLSCFQIKSQRTEYNRWKVSHQNLQLLKSSVECVTSLYYPKHLIEWIQAHFDNLTILAFEEYPIPQITFIFNFAFASKLCGKLVEKLGTN